MDELACLLGRERLLLERLLFKVVTLRALLAGGEARFLPWAAEEVDRATAHLREAELHRAIMVSKIARECGADEGTLSLRMLSRSAPEPFAAIFAAQRVAFRALTSELRTCVATCGLIAGDGASLVSDVLDRVILEADGTRAPARPTMVDLTPLVVRF